MAEGPLGAARRSVALKKSTFIRLFPNLTGTPAYRAPEQSVPPPNQNARSNHHAHPDP